MKQQDNKIHVGMKFTSAHFSDSVEIVAVREQSNEVDVKLTSSQGFARIENGWNLQHTKWEFERGEYIPIDPEKEKINISVI